MNYAYVFLDFDRTLFDHDAYDVWTDQFLTRRFGAPAGLFRGQIDSYHDVVGDNIRYYRHAEHFAAVAGRSWEYVSAELERQMIDEKADFCYPEVHGVLRWLDRQALDVRILTFGDGEYQRYKLNICPLLHRLRLPVHVVRESKASFLSREFNQSKGLLVDDKCPLKLPSNWTEVWLNRSQRFAEPNRLDAATWHISNLQQLKAIV